MAAKIPYFELNNGTKIPSVGMGCWMGQPGLGNDRVENMVRLALKNGYRHFDTAFGYGNEEYVGRAIRESGIPRDEIYLVTKLINTHHHTVREGFELSLKNLDCGYIDLYLMHWPQAMVDGKVLRPDEEPTFIDTWKEMEKLLETGKVKSIGVSNFSIKTLTELLPHCSIVPVTNQVQIHPCLPVHELKAFCEEKGIILTAYSPLGQYSSPFFTDPTIVGIAEKYEITPAQVLLSWGVQRNTVVVPKSENEGRMIANITLYQLAEEDVKTLDDYHKQPGMHKTLLTSSHVNGTVFGWTYDQLGWPQYKEGGVIA